MALKSPCVPACAHEVRRDARGALRRARDDRYKRLRAAFFAFLAFRFSLGLAAAAVLLFLLPPLSFDAIGCLPADLHL